MNKIDNIQDIALIIGSEIKKKLYSIDIMTTAERDFVCSHFYS